jgi:hypothetical protein
MKRKQPKVECWFCKSTRLPGLLELRSSLRSTASNKAEIASRPRQERNSMNRDWAERAAERCCVVGGHWGARLEKAIIRALRRAEKRGWRARWKYDEDVRMGRIKP